MHGFIPQIVSVTLIFMLAGGVKGVTGMGLPTVAMGLLGLLLAPAEAAAFLVIPSLATNVWQFAAGAHRMTLLRRMWPMLLMIAVATCAGAGLIAGAAGTGASTALGVALIVYATIGLARVRLAIRPRWEAWAAPVVGATTGLVTGATGVFVIPAVPYLQALGLEKDELVQALGLSFTVSTIALAAGLASYGALHVSAAYVSALCTLPALAGMHLGQMLRAKVDAVTFRKVFFVGVAVLGADLAARSLL